MRTDNDDTLRKVLHSEHNGRLKRTVSYKISFGFRPRRARRSLCPRLWINYDCTLIYRLLFKFKFLNRRLYGRWCRRTLFSLSVLKFLGWLLMVVNDGKFGFEILNSARVVWIILLCSSETSLSCDLLYYARSRATMETNESFIGYFYGKESHIYIKALD